MNIIEATKKAMEVGKGIINKNVYFCNIKNVSYIYQKLNNLLTKILVFNNMFLKKINLN